MKFVNETDHESPFTFPCRFPIKVMGRHEAEFEAQVVALISEHSGTEIPAASVRTRASSNGRFLAVTITIDAESREQLDAIYRALTAAEQVLFVL
ncbi:MAG: DUF493 domain-containing protein [Gammaproteobacteria bacterium]|nr:MAG: DUF493 domain-containing protein [Gammaproteobacteria bacterium]